MTDMKKCSCCPEGCDCGDCGACSKSGSGMVCGKGSCTSGGYCGMSWWKWLLAILLLGFAFVAGSFHGMRESREGRGWRGGESCSMMKMMDGEKGAMKGMMGCGMKDGGNCGMEGCGMMKEKEGSITTGQIVMTGEVGTGN